MNVFAPNEQFSNPDITLDKQTDYIYIADSFNNYVIKFSATGNIITQWGTQGSGDALS
jgi:DNA-binding beta-propeller fold protein YncE